MKYEIRVDNVVVAEAGTREIALLIGKAIANSYCNCKHKVVVLKEVEPIAEF